MAGRSLSWKVLSLLVVLGVGAYVVCSELTRRVGAQMNRTSNPGPYIVSEDALAVHRSTLVVDLHADPLLWNRDLLKRGDYGHVDLPRLAEGGVGLQVFGAPTKTPKGLNFQRNSGDTDRITALAIAQGWPPATWFSLMSRARHMSRRLARLEARSGGRFEVIHRREGLERLIQARRDGETTIGGLMALEGVHALEGRSENVERLFDAGYRMLGLAHFFDNAAAGSAHGVDQGGLTDFGREVVAEAARLGMIIDLAHSSPTTIRDVLAITQQPVLVSHTGVRGTCDSPRNLANKQLRGIAATGGVIAIGIFKGATCGTGIKHLVDAVLHAVRVAGIDHVALGLDLDGAVTSPIDVAGTPLITQALLKRGLTPQQVRKILGENALRVLLQTLPAEPSS